MLRPTRFRSMLLFWFLAAGFLLVMARAIQFQVRPDPRLTRFASSKEKLSQQTQKEDLLISRGSILDRENRELALSIVTKSFFANPKVVRDPKSVARRLAPLLQMPASKLQSLLSEDRYFVWLKREVDEETARRIEEMQIEGVDSRKESKRVYPQGELARAVVGISGRDGTGLEGLEKFYDEFLKGRDQGNAVAFRDALGRLLLFKDLDKEWFDHAHLILTLDLRLQRVMEEELAATVKEKNALSGQAVMMNPKTGEILAMASIEGARGDRNEVRNRVVADLYEPGSTFKVILAAAAMEQIGMSPSSQIFGENGAFRVGNRTIKEFHGKKYQWLSLQELLEVSSNVASAKIGLKIGATKFYETIARLGFGKTTGIDLPGEEGGLVRRASDWKPIELANISFGQGIGVTPLQLARAVAALSTGGLLPKPYVVSRIVSSRDQGKVLWEATPERDEVYPADKARKMTEMLTHVTEAGSTGAAAAIEGYEVAGKTGTAQKLVETKNSRGKIIKTYANDRSVVSFVGYVPARDPAFVLAVIYDDPKGRVSGGATAAPSFKKIASKALAILGVPPARSSEKPANSPRESNQAALSGKFVGRSFREVLKELQKLPPEGRAKVDLVGYGTAVREEAAGEKLIVYFE